MELNIEQKRLVQLRPNGHILIKGVAGSGKTTVAVHRIPYLLNSYCFDNDDRILMLTYNKTLVYYLSYLYNKVDSEMQMSFDLLVGDKDKVEIKSIDGILFEYFSKWVKENNKNYTILTDTIKKYNLINQSIAELQKIYPNVSLLDQKNNTFLLDEIEWIKSCNYMEESLYQNADRLGRMSKQSQTFDTPQRIMKNSPARKAIFDLMLLYNKKLKENNYVDFKDMSLIVLDYLKKLNNIKKYTHIIIDESQDLTRVQLEILNLLYNVKNYSSITFIADTAQSIYNHSWLVKGRSFTSIGYDMTGKSNQLTKNYRTTAQIAKCAYSLIEKDTNIIEDENFVKPSLIDRQGALPVFKIFDSIQEEAKFIANEIKNNLSKDYNLRDIAIVCKIKKYLDEINSYLKDSGIEVNFLNKENPQFEENSVKLLTMHSIKGLEFKIVFAVGLNKKIIPSINFSDIIDVDAQETVDRKLLYVAMTRANEMLYLTSSETPSKFIDDIDKNYLRISSSSNIKKFYKIKTEDFLFTNKIINIYSKEELVRQWLLKELIETYKYPIELIDVEYKINTFSKVGIVDAAIFIYKNNKKIPFIFFETKSFNSKTNSALEQLKSYLNCSSCFYGAATDGNNFVVIDRNGNIIDDIPSFDTSMLPTGIEEYTYIDLKHCRTFEIKRNINDISNISILEQGEETQLKENETIKLNIYSKIAAGSPIPICNDKVSDFFLPENIVSSSAEHYILKVKGDSMIGAQIDDGDLVVIQKTNTAENRDIVAVSLGEEATLKRFTRMGGSVLLIPENPKYEPINIRDEQARILGIAVGIIKKKS